jgi:WD40 repeat protein
VELFDIAKGERLVTLPARESVGLFEPDGGFRVAAIDELKNPRQPPRARRPRLTGHTDSVEAVAFSRNGSFIVSASQDRTAILWDARTAERLSELTHDDQVFTAVFSPDARWVATGDWQGFVRVWETRIGTPSAALFVREIAKVQHASFSSRPDEILTVTESGARLWRLPGSEPLQVLRGHAGKIVSARFAGEDRVVTASDDGVALVWDLGTGTCRAELAGNHGPLTGLAISGTGRYALTGAASGVAVLWDVETGRAIHTLAGHSKQIMSAAFSPDERFVATTSVDRTAGVWDTQSGQVARIYREHSAYPLTIEFSPDGGLLLTGGVDGTARIWTVDGDRDTELRHGSGGVRARFSPDGSRVATAGEDGVLRLWDAASGQQLRELRRHEGVIYTITFSDDGKWLVTGGADCTARVWEVATGEQIADFRDHLGAVMVATLSRDELRLLTGTEFGEVYLFACPLCDQLDGLVRFARGRLRRELTQSERERYLRAPVPE